MNLKMGHDELPGAVEPSGEAPENQVPTLLLGGWPRYLVIGQ